jgi:mannose-6-phosphate isomerase-like protein (cupin superfamily)
MTYLGTTGESSATLRENLDSLEISPLTGTRATFVAPGSATRGEYGLFRWDMGAGDNGAGLHFHRGFSEAFYVLSGEVRFDTGESEQEVGAGGFLYVPPGGLHGFRNASGEPASMLILFAPGVAREEYFKELADIRASGRQLTGTEWADLFTRHDQVNL